MPTQAEILSDVIDKFDRETLVSVMRNKGFVEAPLVAVKSADCGPRPANSVKIRDVTAAGSDAATAIKNAHASAKSFGQASWDAGSSCTYVEDCWECSAPVLKDNEWTATGTSSGHCTGIGDDGQLANVDLQNMLQKQQQTIQMMSDISKMLSDTVMAIIRNLKS